ncbi:MAG: sarcosine oxidase subunit gamma [Silicimonas sp.]|nr:sarcosine oxidase subunit gamma [Silicimonas sp.]
MADITLTATPLLGGTDIQIGDNRILERDDLALVSIATPLGGEVDLTEALKIAWSLDLPTPTQSTTSGDTTAIRTTPDQMLLLFPHPTPDANAVVQEKLGGTGYTTDQTDAWVILEITGPDTMAALERLCPLDLARFEDGTAGRTMMEHMGALILKRAPDHFLLMSASSSAGSFLHAVETSYRYVT